MTMPRPAADRIRPILQAMENSINAARRSRVKEPAAPAQQVSPPPTPVSSVIKAPAIVPPQPPASLKLERPIAAPVPQQSLAQPDSPQRLKAKPKRVNSAFASPFDQPNYRSQAG